jgi:hypothetical protein
VATIGRDTIVVEYDGRGLPAQAEALGRQSGISQGEAHAKAFDEKVAEGQSRTGEKLTKDWETRGLKEGQRAGLSFNDAFNSEIQSKLDRNAREVARVFADEGGLDKYRASLGDVGRGYDGVGNSADSLKAKLQELYDNKQIDVGLFSRLSNDVRKWASNAEQAEAAITSTKGAMASLGEEIRGNLINHLGALDDELNRAHEAAIRVNQDYDSTDNILKRLEGSTAGVSRGFIDARDRADLFTRGAKDLKSYEADLARLPKPIQDVRAAFHDGKAVFGDVEKAVGGLGKAAEGGVVDLEKLGGAFDDVGKKAASSAGKGGGLGGVGLWTGVIVAVVGLVVALLPEIAALGSALGGLALEGGIAFGAVAIGALAFKSALSGMFGPLNQLPGVVQPAAAALQSIFGSDNAKGKFVAGGMLTEIQTILQTHVFQNLAGAITMVANNAFPAFKAGAISIGDALHGVASEFANAFAGNNSEGVQNRENFQKFLVGLGPIIRQMGAALIDFGNGLTGILAAATPYVLEFAKNIHSIAEGFGNFFSQQKGQDAIVTWLKNVDAIAPHLGNAVGGIGKALHDMVTPDSIHNLNLILDSIGTLALALGTLGNAVTPVATAIASLVNLISLILVDFAPTIGSLLDGISSLVIGLVATLSPVVTFLANDVINPIAGVIGAFLNFIGQGFSQIGVVFGGVFGGLGAAMQPLVDLITNGLINAFKTLGDVLSVAKPVYAGVAAVFQALGSGVGSIIGAFLGVGASVLDFKGKANDLHSFIHGPLAATFDILGGKLKDFANFITTTAVPYIKTQLIPAFTSFWQDIQKNVVPAIESLLPKLGDIASFLITQVIPALSKIDFAKMITAMINFGTAVVLTIDILGNLVGAYLAVERAVFAWVGVVVDGVGVVLTTIGGAAAVLTRLVAGDFVGAFHTAQDAMGAIGGISQVFAGQFVGAITDTSNAAKAFGGTAQNVANDVNAFGRIGKDAFQSLSKEGKVDLETLATTLNLTGGKARAFESVVADVSGGSKTKLAALAKDGSLAEVEKTLGLTGAAAKAFEARVTAAMDAAANSTDVAKNHTNDLTYAVKQLPNGKNVVITETGAADAQRQVEALNSQLRALHDRQINIGVNATVNSKYAQGLLGNEFGGVIAGGRQIAGGRAFAYGGVLNTPTWFGNSLAGEAGPEAIVPLSKPISQVDPSVRALAAFARGMTPASPGKTITIAPGAIQVVEAGNGQTTAGAVLDRLAAKLGG